MAAKKKSAIELNNKPKGIIDDIFKEGGKALTRAVRRDVRKAIKLDNSADNVIMKGARKNWSKATGTSVDARLKAEEHFAKKMGIKHPVKQPNQTLAEYDKEIDKYRRKVQKSGLSKALREERAILNAKRAKAGRKPVVKNAGKIIVPKIPKKK